MENLTINWKIDALDVICAKQELEKFLNEQSELKGRCPKIDSYHEKRINELIQFIKITMAF